VTSNVDSMRRGQELQTPLTERIEALSLAGYLQILGHVGPVAAPWVEPEPAPPWAEPEPEPAPAARLKRSRRKPAEVSDGGSESPA
jgi:hypothetical protein